jgi:hypothetical protein
MYLYKKTYVKNWDFMSDEQRHSVLVKLNGKKHPYINENRISEITEEVMYWRKANHIHKWFVDNVQEGKDDCGTYYVDEEQLQKLKETCEKILKDRNLAESSLPRQGGFFFGGTEYDEYYFRDTEDTLKILNEILPMAEGDTGEFYYYSSW